jgi:phospholipid transport system substrate-binding protein
MFKRRTLIVLLAAMLTVAGVVLPPHSARAATAANAEAFIDSLVAAALKTITAEGTEDAREKAFRTLLDANFDVPRISRFVLGRYWLTASDADKRQYLPLFETYVVRAYANRFSDYAGETVKVTGSRPQGDLTVVSSQIIETDGAPSIKVDWVVRKDGDDYRITDVSVDGVSMVLTEKQQFAAVMERDGSGLAGLNKVLAAKLSGSETALK